LLNPIVHALTLASVRWDESAARQGRGQKRTTDRADKTGSKSDKKMKRGTNDCANWAANLTIL